MGAAAAAIETSAFYYFKAETDPEKIRKAEQKFKEGNELFKKVCAAYDQFGDGSPQVNMALIEYEKWQEGSRCST